MIVTRRGTARTDRAAFPTVFDIGAYRIARRRMFFPTPDASDASLSDVDCIAAELRRTSVELPDLVEMLRVRRDPFGRARLSS